jgi:hypothetical protein
MHRRIDVGTKPEWRDKVSRALTAVGNGEECVNVAPSKNSIGSEK